MLVHTVLFSTLSTLALALSSSPTNDNPCAAPTEGNLIKATWIAPRTFPNCGFAGVGCGSAPGPNGKRKYYCAPFKATCCQQAPEPRARRSRIRRQETVDTAEEQAEADKQVQDVSKDREDDSDEDEDDDDDQGDDDEGDEPIFGKPDGKRSYCPDGYECTGGGKWCKRRPDATVNTNVPGSTKTDSSSATSSTSKHVWTASFLGTSVTLVTTDIRPVKPPTGPTPTPHVKID